MSREFTHRDYKKAKIIHLIDGNGLETFIYGNCEISQEEANKITYSYFEEKEKRVLKKKGVLL